MSLYLGDRLVCMFGWNPNPHTRRSPTYSAIYLMSFWYN